MKVTDKQEFTLVLDKEELNAVLLGLARVSNENWKHNTIEYYGFGGVRQTKLDKVKNMIKIIEKL